MGLFGFGKKMEDKSTCEAKPNGEAACHCQKTGDGKKARFIVLGACCDKSRQTYENTKLAVKELGFADEVLNIGDSLEIAKYGVMQTPALVIDGKVVSYGKSLKSEDVKRIMEKLGVE